MAERLVAELASLPPSELREVWKRVGMPSQGSGPVVLPDQHAALEAIRSLYGRFSGGNMMDHLLQERARDRERERENPAT